MSKVQNFIAQSVVTELSDKLHSKVTLGSVDYKFFNTISLNELYVEDQQRDTLLYVSHANAHFNFWKIFKSKILITSVELDEFYGNRKQKIQQMSNTGLIILR